MILYLGSTLSLLAVVPPAQVEAAVVAHSLTLMMEMPPVQAGTSVLSGIASHAISEATRLQADLEAQGQKLMAWQEQVAVAEAQLMAWQEQVAAAEARTASAEAAHEATAEAAQAAALQHPRMMRLHAPGAGFMSTRDFALRLTEAGLKRERGPQTRAPPSTSTTSSPTQVSHLAFSLRLLTDLSFILAPCHSQMAGQIISTTTCSRSVGASICPSRTASTPSTATWQVA